MKKTDVRSIKIPPASLNALEDEQYRRRKATGIKPTYSELVAEAISAALPPPDAGYSTISMRSEPAKDQNENRFIILTTNQIGAYNGGIEELMRFVGEFSPTLTDDEEKLIRRICQSLSLNIEITIRGQASAEKHQEDDSNQHQTDADPEMREVEDIAQEHNPRQRDPKRSRRKA